MAHGNPNMVRILGALCAAVSATPALADEGGSILQADRWSNALWAVGLFLVLLLILRRLAWKPVLRAIQEREQSIADTVADARRRQAESEQLLSEYRARLDTAQHDAAQIVARSAKEAEATREQVLTEAKAAAVAVTADATRQIEQAKRESLAEIYRTTAELATDVAGRIVKREIQPADHERLVRESIEKLKVSTPDEGASSSAQ